MPLRGAALRQRVGENKLIPFINVLWMTPDSTADIPTYPDVPTDVGFSPIIFEPHPLGYQAAEPLFEFPPFLFEFPPSCQPHQLQPAWYPWGGCRPFFPEVLFECFSEYGAFSPPLAASMRYPWGRLTPIFSSSFHQCVNQYVVASPPSATSVWYPWGRCPPFFLLGFQGKMAL